VVAVPEGLLGLNRTGGRRNRFRGSSR
jgi:hypothetical protein